MIKILLEFVKCNLCGSLKYKTKYRKPDDSQTINLYQYCVVECLDCGLTYVNPRPTVESLKEYYPDGYYSDRGAEVHKKRYESQVKFLPKLSNERVLDIGCARGNFLDYLINKFPDIVTYGVDPFSDFVNNTRINFCSNHLYEANYEKNFFDLITAWAVFEHLTDPDKYFKEVHRILKKGGKFIFLVTNAKSLWSRYAYWEDVPRHLYHFSEETLKKYAMKNGLVISRCYFDNSIFDGKGRRTITFKVAELLGFDWEKRLLGQNVGFIKKSLLSVSNLVDKIVFSINWEVKIKKSGIIIMEFTKNE